MITVTVGMARQCSRSRFLVCVALDRPDGQVWAVRTRRQWHTATAVQIAVPLTSVFRGRTARQPRVYLRGVGCVRRLPDGTLAITDA